MINQDPGQPGIHLDVEGRRPWRQVLRKPEAFTLTWTDRDETQASLNAAAHAEAAVDGVWKSIWMC